MNHQFEVVPLIAARCQASSQRWDDFFIFLFSHSRWTINIQRKNFHKTHTRVCSRHFPRCGQDVVRCGHEVHIYLRKKSPDHSPLFSFAITCSSLRTANGLSHPAWHTKYLHAHIVSNNLCSFLGCGYSSF